ncbi:hypothetical protein TIFTF001_008891 [Ficus carica]|uniref:Uncharacterized protein n=1 Tax=Ficus carica TaxID=3494 RepID=A0AA87ZVN6_FICCA|nr:hypothetical protein TIFTF001_008891 [Ficus carica]
MCKVNYAGHSLTTFLVNNLIGRLFKLSAIPSAVNIEIQKRSEEIDSTLAAKYSSAVCPIRRIELMITKKFGRQFSFSSQESIDVFSPAIKGRYALYTQNGPIARQVLEYYCEEGIVPAINYPFVGFRRFLSFKASKKFATKLFEVKGREFPLFGVDPLTCSKILNETKTLLALVAENPIIMKFKVGEKFDNWTGWDIYDPKIENSDDLHEEYVVAYGFDDD